METSTSIRLLPSSTFIAVFLATFGATASGPSFARPPTPINTKPYETPEYFGSRGLAAINASTAYSLGFTGRGVVVGVIDSELDSAHPSFRNRVLPSSRNFGLGGDPKNLKDGPVEHGSHVTGIAAGTKDGNTMHGVAYDSKVLFMRMDNPVEPFTSAALKHAVDNGAQVVNMSFGPGVSPASEIQDPSGLRDIPNPNYAQLPYHPLTINAEGKLADDAFVDAIRYTAANDVVMVFATGNEAQEQPDATRHPTGGALLPAIGQANHDSGAYRLIEDTGDLDNPSSYQFIAPNDPRLAKLDYSDLEGALIGAVAVDQNNRIASYSNRCGIASRWCIAAPGGDGPESEQIMSAKTGGGFEAMAGTSMAAPFVTGSVAVLRGAFPYMTARQIIELTLTTANQTGHLADSTVYGRGLLDLGRAAQGPREFGAEGFAQVFDVNTQGHNSIWRGDIGGSGGLTKRGEGRLVVAGTNTYVGPTRIQGGEVQVLGTTTRSHFTVESGGKLSGTGKVGGTRIEGTIAPGSAGNGTLTVRGDYTQVAGSTFEAHLDGKGQSNRLAVDGQAKLEGGRLAIGGMQPDMLGQQYALITAKEGVSGKFDSIQNPYLFVHALPTVSNNTYGLKIGIKEGGFSTVARTRNQRSVANGMAKMAYSNPLFGSIAVMQDPAKARRALTELSGEIHGGVATGLMDQTGTTRDALMNRLSTAGNAGFSSSLGASGTSGASGLSSGTTSRASASNTGSGKGSFLTSSNIWGQYLGSWGKLDGSPKRLGESNRASLNHTTQGGMFGLERPFGKTTRLGAAFGISESTFKMGERRSRASTDNLTLAIYGDTAFDLFRVKYGASVAQHAVRTKRTVDLNSAGTVRGKYNANSSQWFGEISTVRQVNGFEIEPFAGLAYALVNTEAFREKTVAGLQARSNTNHVFFSSLGVRARAEWTLKNSAVLQANAMLGVRRADGDIDTKSTMRLRGGSRFDVESAGLAKHAVMMGAGMNLQLNKQSSVGLSYSNALSSRSSDHTVRADARWLF